MIDFLIFLFTYLPNIIVHLAVILGIVALCISFFFPDTLVPTNILQKKILKYGGICLFVVGMFLEGGLAVNDEYLQRQKEWNARIEIAETKARETNARIEYVFQDKIQKVKETQVVIQERIKNVSVNVDAECKITAETVNILNDSARGKGK
jgi:hypothetical protein